MEIHLIYGVYEVGFMVGMDIGYKPHCLSINPGVIFHYLPHRPRGLYSNVYGKLPFFHPFLAVYSCP